MMGIGTEQIACYVSRCVFLCIMTQISACVSVWLVQVDRLL
jgi:hypothetical protein